MKRHKKSDHYSIKKNSVTHPSRKKQHYKLLFSRIPKAVTTYR